MLVYCNKRATENVKATMMPDVMEAAEQEAVAIEKDDMLEIDKAREVEASITTELQAHESKVDNLLELVKQHPHPRDVSNSTT
jgi:hypothetical protein